MKAHSRHGRARGVRRAAAFGVALAGITALVAAPVPATSPAPTIEPSAAPPAVTAPLSSAAPSETPSPTVENSVVKVFSTLRLPDPYRPWTKQQPSEVSGSGAIIADKRILTNAHVVLHASQVQVQANQAGDRISATIEAIAPGVDLAILKVDDETLFDSRPPLRLRKTLPDAKEQVMVYGYPTGGSSLSITKGIISRIEFTSYSSSVPGVRIQIDAAINPGNSGGPAIVGDEMVGLAFSRLGGTTQNIGYIIPCEEIELFLKDTAHVEYGKPAMYDDLQTLENPALRPFLHIDRSVQGMIVHRPFSSSPSYPLKEWDIITKIGDTPIDNEGMVKVSDHLRMRFQYLIQKIAAQDKVPLTVIRDGKTMNVDLPLLKHRPLVIPDAEGKYPPYFIYGPLVLSEATTDFLTGMRRNTQLTSLIARLTYEGSPLITRVGDRPAFEGERLVVVSSPFFPHKLAKGYGNPAMQVVKTINGKPVKNLAHAVELLRDLKDEFVSFTFDMRSSGETIVFPRTEMAAATEGILTDNGIREEGSPELLTIWKGQKGR